MNRRSLLLALPAMTLTPTIARAQHAPMSLNQATPETEDRDPHLSDYYYVRGAEGVLYQYSEQRSQGLASILDGDLVWIDSFAFQYERESQARFAAPGLANAYFEWARQEPDFDILNVSRASARELGDFVWGFVGDGKSDDTDDFPWVWFLYGVQIGRRVLALCGMSYAGNGLSMLGDIAEQTLDRWSTGEPELKDMLPELNELPEGMVIEDEDDVTDLYG